jgi:hypothetical protein
MGLVLDIMSTNVGILLQRYIFSAYIQIKNDNHTNCLQTKIWYWRSDCTYIDTKYGGKNPALTYKISLCVRTGILHSCTGIHTRCMLLMEPSQRTWKLSDGTAVFNYTQQVEAELGVRTWHGDTLNERLLTFHLPFASRCYAHNARRCVTQCSVTSVLVTSEWLTDYATACRTEKSRFDSTRQQRLIFRRLVPSSTQRVAQALFPGLKPAEAWSWLLNYIYRQRLEYVHSSIYSPIRNYKYEQL